MTPEELLKEIEEIKSLDNPLSYCKNAKHYKNKNAIDSAYIVEQFSQYGYFAAACVKYILRRHHKGQYEQDVIKIMHTYKLARFFCSIGDVSLRSSQNHKSFQIALALIPNMIDKALISVLESALTARDTKIIAITNTSNEGTKKTTIDVTQANADLVFSTILKEEIKEKYGYLNLPDGTENRNETTA